ncbi:ATP-binding protein [Patiriisocius hiemis]|uniref:histidine kinase n=1 Tax=Patiriisocius hiemis TaxID=3075604 RepID=A0ABU2YH82_9FLAO|nr:ATP-binding protein [Constantimarinum sp. W242]MDT0556423.1 ATP-binding protein [Constantimarinum sp. W242]
MASIKNKFTFKIVLSYLVLGAVAVLVSYFLYSEYKKATNLSPQITEDKKFIETGTLINQVFETDGFSRLALLTQTEKDYKKYQDKTDSLFKKIEEIKELITSQNQLQQLDSVTILLERKRENIDQLRFLKLTTNKDTSLDDILEQMSTLENSMGKFTLGNTTNNPESLNEEERKVWSKWVDYFNTTKFTDTSTVKVTTVDSMLAASRYIVAEAKKENSRTRKSLQQKENELIKNDLILSQKLRSIIATFDAEVVKNNTLLTENRDASVQKTRDILKIAGAISLILALVFSYFILTDFFKIERLKKSLELSKKYAENLLKSREQLIATVSHDLKTPLQTITGYTELLDNTSNSLKQKQYISQIHSGTSYITKLVDDLLDFSKLDAGKLVIEKAPFSLSNLIRQVSEAIAEINHHKNVELILEIDQEIESLVFKSDPLRIQQIVNNLIGNAFKFTKKGSVTVKVTSKKLLDNIFEVVIIVKDTGVGIAPDKQDVIFREFTQANDDDSSNFGGYGLGLTISKKLTSLLNGSLTVTSELEKGSSFKLSLPLEVTSSPVKIKESNNTSQVVSKKLTVVILDDDPTIIALLKDVFTQLGISTHAFTSYKELSNYKNLVFDFILTDIQMPTVDGFMFLEKLKLGSIETFNQQPVIAMTGSKEHDKAYYKKKGFSAMLPKPFSKQQLISVIIKLFPDIEFAQDTSIQSKKKSGELYNLSLLKLFIEEKSKLDEILHVFIEQTRKDNKTLAVLVKNKDYGAINKIAHRMLTMFRQIQAEEAIVSLEYLEKIDEAAEANLENYYINLQQKIDALESQIKTDLGI